MAEGNHYQLWLERKKGKSTVEFLDWKLCYRGCSVIKEFAGKDMSPRT